MIENYLPYDSNHVLMIIRDGKLYIYDLNRANLLQVPLNPMIGVGRCTDILATLALGSLSRLGSTDEIVSCSGEFNQKNPEHPFSIIVIANPLTGSLKVIYRGISMPGTRPFRQVIAGPDGFVYIEPTAASSLNTANEEDKKNYRQIVRYDPRSSQWEDMKVPTSLPSWFIAVDKSSNLYFDGPNSPDDRIALAKVASTGEIVWQLTEQDLDKMRIIGITAEGHLILSTADPNAATIQVNECHVAEAF